MRLTRSTSRLLSGILDTAAWYIPWLNDEAGGLYHEKLVALITFWQQGKSWLKVRIVASNLGLVEVVACWAAYPRHSRLARAQHPCC